MCKYFIKTDVVAAAQSAVMEAVNHAKNCAMEADTISKHGQSSSKNFVNFTFNDKNGLPEKMTFDGHVSYFGNFRRKIFDFAIIYPNNMVEYFLDGETDVDWDLYIEQCLSTKAYV